MSVPIVQQENTKVVTVVLPVPVTPPRVNPASINRQAPLLPETVSVPVVQEENTKIKMVRPLAKVVHVEHMPVGAVQGVRVVPLVCIIPVLDNRLANSVPQGIMQEKHRLIGV